MTYWNQFGAEGGGLDRLNDITEADLFIRNALWGESPQEWLDYSSTLNDIMLEGFTKIIMGEEPIDYFDVLVEQWYSAKFVTEGQAKRLVDVVCEFVSEQQAERIRHNAFLTDRVKTNNKQVLNSIAVINDAMSRRMNGAPHKPEKISFKYLKHEISNVSNEVERRHGDKYIVSPYSLLINDGNYYLLAVDDKFKKPRTYRIDRMKEVSLTGEPRTGEEHFKDVDIRTYAQRVFGMYGGKQQLVTIRFINPLLDTAVERFGTKDAIYAKVNDRHFSVTANVEISDLFYGWLLGFGKRVKLTYPDDAVEGFRAYLDKVRAMYE